MHTITIHTSDNYTYWAKEGGISELLLSHLTGGRRTIHGDEHLEDLRKLAKAHGWEIVIETESK